MGSDLHAIDETAHSPRPRGVLPRIADITIACSSAEFRVKLVERIIGMVTHPKKRIRGHIVMEEVDGCDRPARKNAGWETAIIGACAEEKERHGNQCGKRAAAHTLWNVNARSQSKRLPIPGYYHCQCTPD